MNQGIGYAYLKNGGSEEEHMRNLAQLLPSDGWAVLCANKHHLRVLRRYLRRFEDIKYAFSVQDDAFCRLNAEIGSIESLMARAKGICIAKMPACEDEPRIFILAREMLSNGEIKPDEAGILRSLQAFSSVQTLGIRELLFFPEAMTLAIMQEIVLCCKETIHYAEMRRNAQIWVECGGKGRLRSNESAIYLEHALKCAEESEDAALHKRIEESFGRSGLHIGEIRTKANALSAKLLLRTENLIAAWHMLRRLDWQKCYEAVSTAEAELNEDPSGVYPNMDDESRARIRTLVCEAAKKLDLEEHMVINAALSEARHAMKKHGKTDPRATICYYLAENEGRCLLSNRLNARKKLGRIVPDESGRITAISLMLCAVLIALAFARICGNMLVAVFMLPLAWVLMMQALSKFYPIIKKPNRLLKMQVEKLGRENRVLVVVPVLLSGEGRAREMLERMETIGCLETDENIDFLLLGDFADADSEICAEDAEVVSTVCAGVDLLNEKAQRKQYFYLHRGRKYRRQDGKWMAENRKRGAVRALNALILNRPNAKAEFSAENQCAQSIAEAGYRFVVTLDADTMYVPGTLQKLLGAMLHPLNRICEIDGVRHGYAVLQPTMQLAMHARKNDYAALMNAVGGTDSYPLIISDFYQDICGCGSFSGKGIYDVRAYYESCEGVLREERTLSHDMVEGIFGRCGRASDVFFYESCPCSLAVELNRAHRWMRGDWQNAYLLFSRCKIRLIDRMRIAANLLQSLYAPILLGLLILSAWSGNVRAFALGIALAFANALLHPFSHEKVWRSTVFRLSILPSEAKCALDAVLRTLWRCSVSKKHLMEWTTAADAGGGERIILWGRIAAIAMLPALLNVGWVAQTIALAMLFWVGGAWSEDLKGVQTAVQAAFTAEQVALLGETALKTWRFFERFVPEDGNGLPPDNVQLDPPAGIAHRTSPTNIGLYLMSCLAAYEMGFLRMEAALKRVRQTLSTLEKLEKWQGQLYNWYDTQTLKALKPRYVSSVDSGNLAAALLLIAHAFENADRECANRARTLAKQMDFRSLYDENAELFRIGIDVENHIPAQAHYDLYASEARILSFAAMMLGQIPTMHWHRLNRASVNIGGKTLLASWSGTMFEYLMPELLMRSHPDSLAGISAKNVVLAQMKFAERCARPWGISESGYYAFDMRLNYQYRAFGLKMIALSANAAQDVVAPYASALALCSYPSEATENLNRMRKLGWMGEYGFFEAADYLKTDLGKPRLVKSHMAHHQGMLLCAICNAMRDHALSDCFMDIPEARALEMLLEEKPSMAHLRLNRRTLPRQDIRMHTEKTARTVRRERYCIDTHLLSGCGTTALLTGRGAAYVWHDGIQLNRFSGDLMNAHEGMYVHIASEKSGESRILGASGKYTFDLGLAETEDELCGVRTNMKISVSPENGALIHAITLKNNENAAQTLAVSACLSVALAPQSDMRAHPTFQNLFIECSRISDHCLCFARRPRTGQISDLRMLLAAFGERNVQSECDLEKLVGRNGALGMPGGISERFEETEGSIINPCAALKLSITLLPGEERQIHFALVCAEKQKTEEILRKLAPEDAAQRSSRLSSALMRTDLHSLCLSASQHRMLQRAAALLLDAHFQPEQNRRFEACAPTPRALLWRAGISGELPILLADIASPEQMQLARDVIRMHSFYRDMGVSSDIVLINSYGNAYHQPVHDAIRDAIACTPLGGMIDQSGGVHIIDRQNADANIVSAIERSAALYFHGDQESYAQLDRMLDVLNLQKNMPYRAMSAVSMSSDEKLALDNGYGGFRDGGYLIRLHGGQLPPAPWCNIMSEGESGAVISERCGGFAWHGNSRSGRLTAFTNDVLHEDWGWMFYAVSQAHYMRLLPGDKPMTDFSVFHRPGGSRFIANAQDMRFEIAVRPNESGMEFELGIENTANRDTEFMLVGFVDWLLGVDENDRRLLRTWNRMGACFASGAMDGVGYFACDDPRVYVGASRQDFLSGGTIMHPLGLQNENRGQGGWVIELPIRLKPHTKTRKRFILGAEKNAAEAYERARNISDIYSHTEEKRRRELQMMKFDTPNEALNLLANGFLQAQTLDCRILAKTGLYQPGGAYGFRDQLQDMLMLIHYQPKTVRSHLLKCAARQFEAGDVLHWWHEPMNGVRTRISDDKLFLPYVTAEYVRITGDEAILSDSAAFLKDVPIPPDREDVYAPMQLSENTATLHEHCMRAFYSAEKTGIHGLCLMGSGDWNDGMNRIGSEGRGESVWLSMFAAVCAKKYAEIISNEKDRAYLLSMNERLRSAIEENGWDGEWYLRAYADDGRRIGGKENETCRIDVISQAWSAFAGLQTDRVHSALDAVWMQLVDWEAGAVRLLAPPFDGEEFDPGYIAAYPAGVRENGAQYTHAACWYGCALAEVGETEKAHKILNLLIPANHALDHAAAEQYRVEPYVIAADVYTHPNYLGRGGWTWYTGSAQWMLQFILAIFGYERRQNRVRIRPLLGSWERASMSIRFGSSEYVLSTDVAAQKIMLDGREISEDYISMCDDGKIHRAMFPPRNSK